MHDDLMRKSRSRDFTLPGAGPHYPPDLELEPRHLDISLAFDIPAKSAAGAVVTTLKANRSGARRIRLEAVSFEDLDVADQDGRGVSHRYDGESIDILWDDAFEKDEERNLRVSYRVADPVSGLTFAVPDAEYPDRAPWAATDHETERARHWLPCVDFPAVRTTLTFHLTASGDYTILANGRLESEADNGDGTKTAHWRLEWPCPSYLICMALGDLVRADDEDVDGRPVAYFGARGRATKEDLKRSFGRTPEFIRWFEKKLGVPFPFPKYFQFGLPSFGGAMENISLVSWDDIFITDEVLHSELGDLVDIVNVHEMAHSYFGDAVVVRDFAHAWLKESWAVYMEACWREDCQNEDEYRYDMFQNARAYMDEADSSYVRPIMTRVFDHSWSMYDRHLYPGGACRIHMLRRLLGDEVFWPAVTDYLNTYLGKTVETEDFRRILEEHSGKSLVRFFDEWIHGLGYPKLKATFAHDKEKGQATVTVEQSQVPESQGAGAKKEAPKASLFHFPLTVAWERPDGKWERRDFDVEKRKHTFLISMPGAPKQIRLDPDGTLLHHLEMNPGDAMLRRALQKAPDIVGRIQAAEELAKTGKVGNIREVGKAFAKEPFWGVRQAMAAAIGKSRSAAAVGVMVSMLESEKDPRVLAMVAGQAAGYRDSRIASALAALLDRSPPYRVAAVALRSLGCQRGEEHLERLLAAAEDTGYRGLVRGGALRGLAETHSRAGFKALLARQGYGREPDDTAPVAAEALGGATAVASRRNRGRGTEVLIDVLRDPRQRVRLFAARALGAVKAPAAVPALEGLIKTLPEEDHPSVRRIIEGIRKDGTDAAAAAKFEKELSKLETRHRKLEERLDLLEAAGEKDAKKPKKKKKKGKKK